MEAALFVTAGAGALITALLVLMQRSAVLSALFLVLHLGCIAVLFLALGGHFLAAVQVIVYAGAIMVLFLFVVMLLNPEVARFRLEGSRAWMGLTLVLGGLLAGALIRAVTLLPASASTALPPAPGFGSTEDVGRHLFGPYLYPFELAGILLLVAMVGSVVLARREE